MTMGMEVAVFLAYAFGALMVYVFGRFLLVPVKWLLCLMLSSAVGGVLIILINLLGATWGIFIPLNIITAAVTGILGVPGLLLLLLFFA